MVTAQCPQCGKKLIFNPARGAIVCPACGAKVFAPPPAASEPTVEPVDDLLSAVESHGGPTKRPVAAHSRSGPIAVLLVVGIIAGVVAAFVIHIALRRVSPSTPPAQVAEQPQAQQPPLPPESPPQAPPPDVTAPQSAAVPATQSKPDTEPSESPSFVPRDASAFRSDLSVPAGPSTIPSRRIVAFPQPRRSSANSPRAAAADDADDRIGLAMQRAADMLLAQFQGARLAEQPNRTRTFNLGLDALCVYSLLEAGKSLSDDRLNIHGKLMPSFIDALKAETPIADRSVLFDPVTYTRSLRAAALAVYDRPQDHRALQEDVRWLIRAETDGAYTYDDRYARGPRPLGGPSWDNSNSQYGLLGVWAGAEVGVEVPGQYWRDVERHWTRCQLSDGQWFYSAFQQRPSLAMTCGGIASLMVTYDWLDLRAYSGAVGRDPFPGALGRGIRRLETGDNSVDVPARATFYLGYDLYSLERVGLATGFKFFGTHDWYRELSAKALTFQWPQGGFGRSQITVDSLVDTAYTLLFLARGRSPIFMNKLRYDGWWANRPRDIANLTRYASRELERNFNWQVVNADRPWQDWMDAPVLYISGHEPPKLTDDQYANLRRYVEAGGLIFTEADNGSAAFNRWIPELARRICPDDGLPRTLADDDPLYSVLDRIARPHPRLEAVGNGARWLLIHSPSDLSIAWQRRDDKMRPAHFQLGLNIFIYAAGKTDFRNRLASLYVPDADLPDRTVQVARVRYAGNWNPEPYAWTRFDRLLRRESDLGLDLPVTDADELLTSKAPLAHLTGTAAVKFPDALVTAVRAYVNNGGVLLIDSCGGRPEFARSVREDLLPRAFPAAALADIPPDHPLHDGRTLRMRTFALDTLGSNGARIQMFTAGRGCVIFSPLDLVSGLLGTQTWGIAGWTPASSKEFLRELIDWAPSRPPE